MIYPGGRFFGYFDFVHKNSITTEAGYDEERWIAGAAGSGGVGLNFVVIKLGLHNMPPLMLAGLRLCVGRLPGAAVCIPPGHPAAPAAGYGLTISFGQFAFLFCAIGLGMPAGLASLVLQAQAFFSIILGAFVFGERLQGKQLAGSPWRSLACWCWWRAALAGSMCRWWALC
ncbi:EamA family transporter [Klebsiella variicola subsp. variicola]|nr:EamA family transporter [Klebsiella variicola subsp. variicola]